VVWARRRVVYGIVFLIALVALSIYSRARVKTFFIGLGVYLLSATVLGFFYGSVEVITEDYWPGRLGVGLGIAAAFMIAKDSREKARRKERLNKAA
jgi:hypothetical protein